MYEKQESSAESGEEGRKKGRKKRHSAALDAQASDCADMLTTQLSAISHPELDDSAFSEHQSDHSSRFARSISDVGECAPNSRRLEVLGAGCFPFRAVSDAVDGA